MGNDEREAWIKIHKDELEKEEKKAFEEQVKEQKNLREFVDGLKKKDIEKAENAVKGADAAAVRDNEYNKFIKDRQEKGQPLPAGETLKKDAEALKKAEEAKTAEEPKPVAEPKPEQPKKDK